MHKTVALGVGVALASTMLITTAALPSASAAACTPNTWLEMPALDTTLIGPDRPVLVEAVAAAVAEHGGNWLEGRMAHLAGKFADGDRRENRIAYLPRSPTRARQDERARRMASLQMVC